MVATKKSASDTTTPKSAVKKTASTVKAPAAVKAPAKKAAAPKKSAAPQKAPASKIGAEEHYRMVEVAAYFIAERNNFAGHPVEFWTQAEKQINKLLEGK